MKKDYHSEIELTSEEIAWNFMFNSFREFKRAHGHVLGPLNSNENLDLWKWINEQRKNHLKISNDKKILLNNLGFAWSANDIKWEKVFIKLLHYKEIHGDCLVPRSWHDKSLANWVQFQRMRFSVLPHSRIKKLNEINFSWIPHKEHWEENFLELKLFYQLHSPYASPKGALRTWVITQRQRKNLNLMSPERQAKLDSIGFVWDFTNEKWEKQFQALWKFKNDHGHLIVPQKANLQLFRWIIKQRLRKNKLELVQIKKLNDLGFSWNPLDDQWEDMFSKLIEFKKIHGHCNVPQDFKNNPQLGTWVSTQRSAKINDARKERLEAIGLVWLARRKRKAA